MIDHINKLIFIHLEKAGGSSMEVIFTGREWWGLKDSHLQSIGYDNGQTKHINLRVAKIVYEPYIHSYRKFCIVRHPYTLFISKLNWFGYAGLIMKHHIDQLIAQDKHRWNIDFLHEFLGPKTEYDFIIHFENYEEDYYKMLETFGLDKDKFKLIHTFKASDGVRYKSIVLSDEAKRRIQEYCREYANRFDYEL